MHPISALLLFAALTILSVAHGDPQGFSIPLQRVRRVPPHLPSTNILTTDVSMINRHEFAYMISVSVGGQDFSVILDTGSSDFWIVSAECSMSDCDGVQKYYAAQSPTLSISEKSFELSYLMGSVLGNIGFETVDIGPFSISSQVFALANYTVGLGLSNTGNSGILGLAFPSIAAISLLDGETLLDNTFANFDGPNRFFAFQLGRGTGVDDANSSVTFGKLDPNVTDDLSSFSFTPVSQAGGGSFNYWKLPLHSLVIDSVVFPLSASLVHGAYKPIAVLDTGTTLILGPTPDVDAFWRAVSQQGATRKNLITRMWEVRCDRGVSVSFVLGDDEREYPVDPGDINWQEGGSSGGWCMGGIQANDGVNSGDWLLGDVFLRARYPYNSLILQHLTVNGQNVYVTHHLANSTHPPLIGLLNLTNPLASILQFREERGPDQSLPSTPWVRQGIPNTHEPRTATVYAVSTVSGFVGGAILTLIIRIRRNR